MVWGMFNFFFFLNSDKWKSMRYLVIREFGFSLEKELYLLFYGFKFIITRNRDFIFFSIPENEKR